MTRFSMVLLSFQYHFVTPVTSLIVVQPNSEKCKDYEDDNEEELNCDDKKKKQKVPTTTVNPHTSPGSSDSKGTPDSSQPTPSLADSFSDAGGKSSIPTKS